MSDGILYEGFRIMQVSKNLFKTFTFLMKNCQFEGSLNAQFNVDMALVMQ